MLTNRHVVVAIVVAPVLSLAGWWGVGEYIGEHAKPARAGDSYPLLEKSNCRYASGACNLENGEFSLTLVYTKGVAGNALLVRSSHPLDGLVASVAPANDPAQPVSMGAVDKAGLHWRLALARLPDTRDRIRLVAGASGSVYFGDAGTIFIYPDTVDGSLP
tara:strand:+ start:881 stop:1363 length:483 start_codon:yes stop_codon:yes gene_type:complete